MRFMIIVKANAVSEAETNPADGVDPELMQEMIAFHEDLQKAGVLLDANGLKPSSKGWRVKYQGERRTVVDGPFTETKELVGGYTVIKVNSREEAMEWSRRFPNPFGKNAAAEIEVRELYEEEDFA